MAIDKLISFHIEKQFPAIYREDGAELVQFVKEYYKFLETNTNQSLYNGRRIYEYRDIDTTLERMLLFFKNKYLSDLSFNDTTVRIIIKNILGLYRRKGTKDGLELFFQLFYDETIKVYNPSRDMLRPSDSEWKKGRYLQMFPNDGVFTSTRNDLEYSYQDIVGKNIIGEASKAQAVVDKINIIILNNSVIPIVFINDITGDFIGLEGIVSVIDGIPVRFGIIDGSLSAIDVDTKFKGTLNNNIGDIVTFNSVSESIGARGLVTAVTEEFTGIVEYNILDGGWGYSTASTKLLASNQVIFMDNTDLNFTLLERLEDTNGNTGVVIGQTDLLVAVKADANTEFSDSYVISTVDRTTNVTLNSLSDPTAIRVIEKNETSPGDLFPDTLDANDVKLAEITNTETVSLIFDVIGDFVNVPLNSSDYNAVGPAAKAMTGTASPVTIATPLNTAFDLSAVDIGTIVRFDNINPGTDYVNDVFSLAYDTRTTLFERKPQEVTLQDIPATLNIGDEVTQGSVNGKVIAIQDTTITIIPFSYYGFNSTAPVVFGGENWPIVGLSTKFDSINFAGYNADIESITNFGVGRITNIDIIDSGYGYRDKEVVDVIDSAGRTATRGTISARAQGSTGGYWASLDSHLNGYTSKNGALEYFDSGKRVQDSEYYQEYSYEIQSKLDTRQYEENLKEITHVAGTKLFGRFNLEDNVESKVDIDRVQIVVDGVPLPVVPVGITAEASIRYVTSDTNKITADGFVEGHAE